MEKSQYQCIKAALNEIESYKSDGYEFVSQCSVAGCWWMRYMKHPNGNSILVEMNAERTELRVFVNNNLKKCQKFGA